MSLIRLVNCDVGLMGLFGVMRKLYSPKMIYIVQKTCVNINQTIVRSYF